MGIRSASHIKIMKKTSGTSTPNPAANAEVSYDLGFAHSVSLRHFPYSPTNTETGLEAGRMEFSEPLRQRIVSSCFKHFSDKPITQGWHMLLQDKKAGRESVIREYEPPVGGFRHFRLTSQCSADNIVRLNMDVFLLENNRTKFYLLLNTDSLTKGLNKEDIKPSLDDLKYFRTAFQALIRR